MAIAAGIEVYNVDSAPVVARGITYSQDNLNSAISGPVAKILKDNEGNIELETMLAGIASTDFEQSTLTSILNTPQVINSWRVGEALAESYLVEHCDCYFPWTGSRDLKSSSVSPAGADLVGFKREKNDGESFRFAFGEVKTSQENKYPPQTMYGRHGMTKQLENLRNDKKMRNQLVRYLGHHAPRSDWSDKYRSATKSYLADTTDVSLYGFLVRDVAPNKLDLESRAAVLANNCPTATTIMLRAMYLPKESIDKLKTLAIRAMEGKHVNN